MGAINQLSSNLLQHVVENLNWTGASWYCANKKSVMDCQSGVGDALYIKSMNQTAMTGQKRLALHTL